VSIAVRAILVNPCGMRRLTSLAPALLPLLLLVASAADAAPRKKPAAATPAGVVKEAKASSVWEPLVVANARFVLHGGEGESARIIVESYDVRTVKGAKVARLRWVVEEGGARSPMGNSLPTQIAVTKKGAWLLTDRLDDKAVGEALRGKPTFTDPPRAGHSDDGYVRKDGEAVCVGIGTPPETPCPAGVCHAEYCLEPGVGLTSMSGNYTPSAGKFAAHATGTLAADLRTGVPECDAFLLEWARCVQESFGPDMRDSLNDAIRQMAVAYRQQAATPEGAKQAGELCREVAPQMSDALRDMGCKL
jgi:hypothetical protein